VRPAHVFELASALKYRAYDDAFWMEWARFHPPGLRALQTVAFQFASVWFDTALPDAVQAEWARQPQRIHTWFSRYAYSPFVNLVEPNKDVLWLHLALLQNWQDRARVLRRRLIPLRLPQRAEAHSQSYTAHLLHRAGYHVLALMRAMRTASHTSD
jgi:hypothetical protein